MRHPACIAACFALFASMASHADRLPDEPPPRATEAAAAPAPASYAEALAAWTGAEDVARFLDGRFVYDRARALALADDPQRAGRVPAIHAPEAVFADPKGVCVDVARFGVETLNRIDKRHAARYLMIEFEPVTIEGRTLRRHWIATFERDGAHWMVADSWRPGHVAGPYASVDAFIAGYARDRERTIVAWRVRESFERQQRTTRTLVPQAVR
jgi:hypothetical protein